MNKIEDVVTSANKTWKNIYYLHKPSDFPIQVEGKDEEKEEEEKEEEFQKIDLDKEEEQEAIEEGLPEKQSIEESNPKKIEAEVIASLPHSLRKLVLTSSLEKASIELTMLSLPSTFIQSIPTTVQLGITLTKASKNSSTKQKAKILVTPICTLPFISIPFVSTIVSSTPLLSVKIVEPNLQLRTSFLWSGKGKEEEIHWMKKLSFPIGTLVILLQIRCTFLGNSYRRRPGSRD